MVRNFNFSHKYLYSLLTLLISLNPFLVEATTLIEDKSGKQNKQLKISNNTNNNSSARIANNIATAYDVRVLPATIDLIKQYEGFRSYAYIDSSGLPVIGYGQTRINGRTVRMGQYITRAQADAALEQELRHIQRLVLANVKVDLTPHQLGALTSLVYNAGAVVVTNSTLIRKLNAGDYEGAAREFPRWNKANQGGRLVVFPGLTRRRLAEKNLFLTPYPLVSTQ